MARPKKTGLDYFPLDVDFFSDEKMVCIHGEFGIKGQVVAIHLLCAIYREGYFAVWNEALPLKIAAATGLSADLVKMIAQRLAKWGLFDKGLFDSDGVLTSAGIQRRFFSIARHREFPPDLPHLLVSTEKTQVSTAETPVSNVKNPLKESKVNKNPPRGVKSDPPHPPSGCFIQDMPKPTEEEVTRYFASCQLAQRLNDPIQAGRRFFDHFNSVDWIDKAGRRIVKWKSRANIWIRDELRIQNNNQTNYQNHGPSNTGAARRADPAGQCLLDGIDLVQSYLANPDGDPMP